MGQYTAETLFYASAFCMSAACSLLVTFRDRRYRDAWELGAIAGLSGFAALGVLFVLIRTTGGAGDSVPYYFGISIGVGLLGEKGVQVAPWLINAALKKLGYTANGRTDQTLDPPRGGGDRSDDHDSGDP